MKCSECGTELKVGCVYCPKCGKEMQVSDSTLLEDDFLSDLLEEENGRKKARASDAGKEPGKSRGQEKKADPVKKKTETDIKKDEKKDTGKKTSKKPSKKKKILIGVLCLVCIAAVLGGILGYMKMNSFSTLYRKAEVKYNTGMYEDARTILEKAMKKEPDSQSGYLLMGKICEELGETQDAQAAYQKLLELDPDSADAYSGLLRIYSEQGDYDKIVALKDTASSEEILALFEDYLVEVPQADIDGGEYSDFLEVELSASDKDLEIYYTTDGSDPEKEGEKYEDPISIRKEGETVLKAVCKDRDGNYSEVMEETYHIKLDIPDMPVVSPDGGQFYEKTSITISSDPGTTVYYTWDGSTPDKNSDKYTGALTVPEGNNILSVIAVNDETGAASQVLKTNFIYYPETSSLGSDEAA